MCNRTKLTIYQSIELIVISLFRFVYYDIIRKLKELEPIFPDEFLDFLCSFGLA